MLDGKSSPGQEPSNNGIEQTNGGPRSMTPFAVHPERYVSKKKR